MRSRQQFPKRKALGRITFFIVAILLPLLNYQRGAADDSTTDRLKVHSLIPHSNATVTARAQEPMPDPQAQLIADRLREQVDALRTNMRRNATLAQMTPVQGKAF